MEWTTNMEGGGTLFFRDEGAYLYFEANRVDDGKGLYKVLIQGLSGTQVLGTMSPCETGLKLSRMVSRSTLGQWGCLPVTKAICQQSYVFDEEKQTEVADLKGVWEETEKEEFLPFLGEREELEKEKIKKDVKQEMDEILWEPLEEVFEEFQEVSSKEEKLHEIHEVEELQKNQHLPTEKEELWLPVEEEDGFLPCFHPEQGIFDVVLKEKFSRCLGVLREENVKGFSLAVPYSPHKEFAVTTLFCFGELMRIREKKYVVFSFSKEGKPKF